MTNLEKHLPVLFFNSVSLILYCKLLFCPNLRSIWAWHSLDGVYCEADSDSFVIVKTLTPAENFDVESIGNIVD